MSPARTSHVLPAAATYGVVRYVWGSAAGDGAGGVGGGGGGAGAVTTTPIVPILPSIVADAVALPALLAVTSPVADTLAIVGPTDIAHVTVRPVIVAPCASSATAVACAVCPVVRFADTIDTLTLATTAGGTVTLMASAPAFPSELAVIIVEPAAIPVISPVAETVAVAGAELDQLMGRLASRFPLASRSSAIAWVVLVTLIEAAGALTLTVATGIGTAGG